MRFTVGSAYSLRHPALDYYRTLQYVVYVETPNYFGSLDFHLSRLSGAKIIQ